MLFNGVASGGAARGDSELAVNGGEVPVDGARADDELFGNLSVGEALCDQPQHFHLASGQSCWRGGMTCGSGRKGTRHCLCRWQSLRGLRREDLMRGERLCGGHGAPPGPGLFEGWLAQLAAHHGHTPQPF